MSKADKRRRGMAGYHRFKIPDEADPTNVAEYGSFEVFWVDRAEAQEWSKNPDWNESAPYRIGWYWWSCFPGCLPDSEPNGPFTTSKRAYDNAQESF